MMSDVENAEKCNMPNSPSGPTEKLNQKETFIGSPKQADPTISDGKPFVGMEGELDFEVLSPEKTERERLEEQTFNLSNEADSQTSKTGELEKEAGEDEGSPQHTVEKGNESKGHAIEDGEDDGECSDDEDLEEGEVKDENDTMTKKARQVCRFFSRGTCFYGIQCRFLHLNHEKGGNYNMFSATFPPRSYEPTHMGNMMVPPGQHGIIHRSAPRSGPDFMPVPPLLPAPVPETESAWEKGLREAKQLLKKANKRKEEPDFEEKRLTLSLNAERISQINDKENDKFGYKKKNRDDLYKYGDATYNRAHSRYENFEIRYNMNIDRGMRSRRRNHGDRRFNEREDSMGGNWRNGDRMEDIEKSRSEAYFDPWRRSKSPKHSKDRERSRSFGGSPFSSVSSSYSSRNSSYSRSSSSMSRGLSSRSPSPVSDKKKKKDPPKNLYPLRSPKKDTPNKLNSVKERGKKKPGAARTSSSRSRSMSRGRSVYSSRSSRSLSMDSVSSASSSLSHSSSGESSGRPEHVSILRRQDEKPAERENPELLPPASNSFYFQIPRPIKSVKETDNIGIPDNDRDPLDESFQMSQGDTSVFPSTMQHLMPTERERAKDPVKGLHPPKQQIKLTLLNKNPQSKLSNLPKKDLEGIKGEEAPKVGGFLHGVKRPLSPPVPPAVMKPQPAVPKKSASSRRDELLKQLKAVEDAIARKRAKFC